MESRPKDQFENAVDGMVVLNESNNYKVKFTKRLVALNGVSDLS